MNPASEFLTVTGTRKFSSYVERLVSYGLPLIAFFLFFVSLNHYTEYAFFTLCGIWILTSWKDGTLHWTKTTLDLPIGLFLVWVLITVPWATDSLYSFHEWRKTVTQVLMFYFVVNALQNDHPVKMVMIGAVAGVVGVSLLESWYFWYSGRDLFNVWDISVRGGDFSGSSQWLSVYIVMGFPLLLFGVGKPCSWITRIGFWLCLGLIFVGLIVCHTRAAWVAMGVQGVVYLCLRFFRRGWVALGGGILVVSMAFMSFYSEGRHQDFFHSNSFTNPSSMEARFNTWALAAKDIQAKPLFGLGYGKHSFGKAHPDLTGNVHNHIHNAFLSKAVQIGVPGFVFFVAIFGILIHKAHDLYRRFQRDLPGQLALGILLMIVGVIVRNLFDDMFMGTAVYLFWLLAGLLYCLNNMTKKSPA